MVAEEKWRIQNSDLWQDFAHPEAGKSCRVDLANAHSANDIFLIAHDATGIDFEANLAAGLLSQFSVKFPHDIDPGGTLGCQSREFDRMFLSPCRGDLQANGQDKSCQ